MCVAEYTFGLSNVRIIDPQLVHIQLYFAVEIAV